MELWRIGERVNRIANVLTRDLGLVAGQSRAAARAEQPDDGGLLSGRDEGRRRRGRDHADAARPGDRLPDRARPGSRWRCATLGWPTRWRRRGRSRRCCTYRLLGHRRADEAEAMMPRRPRAASGVRHRQRRCLPDRLHLGHHRRAKGHDAFPSRHAGDLRHLRPHVCGPTARTASSARRRWPSPSASAAGAVPAAGRRLDGPARKARRTICSRHRPSPRHHLLHRPHRLSRDARQARRNTISLACANASPPARPCRARPSRPGAARTGISSWTASAPPRCCTSSSAAGGGHPAGRDRTPVPGYEARMVEGRPRGARRHAGRLAVRGPTGCRYLDDKRQRDYVATAGTSPATPISRMPTAISGTRPVPTT